MSKNIPLYFLTPYNKHPTGGIKQIYRQVDHLNELGFTAFVVHPKVGQRCQWFKNKTKILYNSRIFGSENLSFKKRIKYKIRNFFTTTINAIEKNGILVIPEIYGEKIGRFDSSMNFVIFNQNAYYTFNGYKINSKEITYPYVLDKHLATIVVSEDSQRYLQCAFPLINIQRITLGIDVKYFSYSGQKKKQIAFMPRKLREDIVQILNILKVRLKFPDWSFVAIENKSEEEVSKILKESALFLSTNHREGFGLPPVEAMACGCVTIGYRGQAGREYFKNEFSYAIPDGDITKFVEKVEEVMSLFENDHESYVLKSKSASEYICQNYNLKKEKKEIKETWDLILDCIKLSVRN